MQDITFVGLDVHKATIAVSAAAAGRDGEVRHLGRVENRPEVVRRLVERLRRSGHELRLCYEAGPCGYGLHRQLTDLGCHCIVVAPALIPRRPGDRVKTDRRDATALATLHRAGELTPVWVPDATHEAMRDLVRARATAARALTKARQQLQAFLLRHRRVHAGRAWTRAHRRWLADLRFDHPAQQIVLQDYVSAGEDAAARVARLMGQIAELVPAWSMATVVDPLQAMRGISPARSRDLGRRGRRLQALCQSPSADGVCGPGAERILERRSDAPRRQHQGRQSPCPAGADRGRLDLPLCGQAQSRAPCPQRRAAQGGTRHRLEGAAAPVRPIPASRRRRQAQRRGHHPGRPPDGRVRRGDRLSGATKTRRLNRPRHPAGKGDRNTTTDNFASGHGRRRAAVGNPPSRYEPICDRRSLWSEAAPRRNHGHAAPTRA